MNRLLVGLFAFIGLQLSWAQNSVSLPHNFHATHIAHLEIPKTHPHDNIVTHTGFSLLYDEAHHQADWVAYELTETETHKLFKRSGKFKTDPSVTSGTANNSDYKGSGYDRGHLAPAADMAWSETTMKESFYFSNVSPQTPSFNRGIWKKLEELVRDWAVENHAIYIVTGPVLTHGLPTIGEHHVSVPNSFYKVILDYTEPGIKAIGFIIPNQSSEEPLEHFSVTIDEVEKITGIDFFPALPDEVEKVIESRINVQEWTWEISK